MNCPTCSNEMVLAKATEFGEEYQYCRTCRKELKEMLPVAEATVSIGWPGWPQPQRPELECPHRMDYSTYICTLCGKPGSSFDPAYRITYGSIEILKAIGGLVAYSVQHSSRRPGKILMSSVDFKKAGCLAHYTGIPVVVSEDVPEGVIEGHLIA